MAKDYAKFVPTKQRSSKSKMKGGEIIFIFLLALMLCGLGGFFLLSHHPANNLAQNTQNTAFFPKIFAFLQHKKNIPDSLKTPAKKIAAVNPDAAPAVQFDFYSELPNMQVTLSEPAAAVKGLSELKDAKPPVPELAALNQPVEITPAPGVEEHASLTRQPVIFNTDDLGALLAAESPATQYVIQLGVFESEEAAHRMVAAINSVGFEGSVVKTQHGPQQRFRVQQGPFASRESAKMTQQRMQKRGIISIIRKIA